MSNVEAIIDMNAAFTVPPNVNSHTQVESDDTWFGGLAEAIQESTIAVIVQLASDRERTMGQRNRAEKKVRLEDSLTDTFSVSSVMCASTRSSTPKVTRALRCAISAARRIWRTSVTSVRMARGAQGARSMRASARIRGAEWLDKYVRDVFVAMNRSFDVVVGGGPLVVEVPVMEISAPRISLFLFLLYPFIGALV